MIIGKKRKRNRGSSRNRDDFDEKTYILKGIALAREKVEKLSLQEEASVDVLLVCKSINPTRKSFREA